ncbi:hypothetical protein PVK06_038168 [Gossypium arboreum]|uniref:Uncharacterized protein n=1 Tax=Gossypium arboreum TaxID=29729 RepID=A0ABR0MZR6_GOSAR|nr:hypothetical protein PVK06_038168 [Gossypium arboreum]
MFPFGSVPLKTFLPDGDIDLTALSHQNMEENFARYICSILQDNQQNSEVLVQDVQYIRHSYHFSFLSHGCLVAAKFERCLEVWLDFKSLGVWEACEGPSLFPITLVVVVFDAVGGGGIFIVAVDVCLFSIACEWLDHIPTTPIAVGGVVVVDGGVDVVAAVATVSVSTLIAFCIQLTLAIGT